ncbi:hypothetical protein [Vibrio proteolyticus]|uniref:Uncharacterized protein n=1 Tax=Vibrio proteolyticus NBRC 13287 TaxID=1219065 RepID=U3BAZ4_VIBPR|nr:hypothetical protein [Vibrio proteolyticus]GAD66964.1 hypothetical protein VPR01S_05_02600 [Vibrio proteolyticus NBRC 13287]
MPELNEIMLSISTLELNKGLDILGVLKQGLIGLIFLLSMMAFRLLSTEQKKDNPNATVLGSISKYMYLNTFLALVVSSSQFFGPLPSNKEYALTATVSDNVNSVVVCSKSHLSNRIVLITNLENQSIIQAQANGVACGDKPEMIWLSKEHAENLGIVNKSANVTVLAAQPGQQFTMFKG